MLKNDDEHKIARGIQRQKDASRFSDTVGGIGMFLSLIVGFAVHSFWIGLICFVLSIVLSERLKHKML
ncbi:MAG: hypothetical protein ABF682_09830 [Liquorilactobacillus sp.]|uniref:hypothetical protein n=1 Tax=Liquorilactobacillus TaxID=2767888 RepID=UPI0039E97096